MFDTVKATLTEAQAVALQVALSSGIYDGELMANRLNNRVTMVRGAGQWALGSGLPLQGQPGAAGVSPPPPPTTRPARPASPPNVQPLNARTLYSTR